MKLGISIELYNIDELELKLKAASKSGFKHCQIYLREVDVSDNIIKQVSERCRELGIRIGPVGAYANPLQPGDSPMGWDMEKVKRLIPLLKELDSNTIVMWSGTASHDLFTFDPYNHSHSALEQLVQMTNGILNLLEPIKGILAFEPYYLHVLHDYRSIETFMKEVDSDRVKIVMDPPNFISPDEYDSRDKIIEELIERIGQHIGIVHFKDFSLKSDRTWEYPGPGGGVLNYRLFLDKLRMVNYQSWGIIEHVSPSEYDSARKFLEIHLRNSGINYE